jgi:hypothetical protein
VIQAETHLSFKQIMKVALRAFHDKLAFLKPTRLKRLCSESLRTLAGIISQIEKSANGILRQIILAKIDPVKKAKLADKLENEIAELAIAALEEKNRKPRRNPPIYPTAISSSS